MQAAFFVLALVIVATPFLIGIAVLVVFWWISAANKLIRNDQQCQEAWANVESEMERRYGLIPNLVRTVQAFTNHERELLTKLVALRERAAGNHGSTVSQARDEQALQAALDTLVVRLEAYPELRSNRSYLELQRELATTENRIQAARRLYNGNIRAYNSRVRQFPGRVVARRRGLEERDYFELSTPGAAGPVVVDL